METLFFYCHPVCKKNRKFLDATAGIFDRVCAIRYNRMFNASLIIKEVLTDLHRMTVFTRFML